jgi:hypothetical protein
MNKLVFLFFSLCFGSCQDNNLPLATTSLLKDSKNRALEKDSVQIPDNAIKLIAFYADVISFKDNYIYFSDGTKLIYDDGKKKTFDELLNEPDIEDMFTFKYRYWDSIIPFQYDPGRIRNEEFFKKIYGSTKSQVQENLTRITWCPKLVNQEILVTKVNQIHLRIDSLSKELDEHPEFLPYISNIGGTFNWRTISGSKRLSMHSFGMTIDINVAYSDYWQWSCSCKSEIIELKKFKNRIPIDLVKIFEKYGFIWGGNWYHFDTMHFEYRPELI